MATAKTYQVTYRPAPTAAERRTHDRVEISEYYTAANPTYAIKKAEDERGPKIEVLRVVEVVPNRGAPREST